RKASPRSIVASTSAGLWRSSWADAAPDRMTTTMATVDRMSETPDAAGSIIETPRLVSFRHVQSTRAFGTCQRCPRRAVNGNTSKGRSDRYGGSGGFSGGVGELQGMVEFSVG